MREYVKVACERTEGVRWEPRHLFEPREQIIYDPNLPADSVARTLQFRVGHILIRPYSPQGFRDIECLDGATRKIYLEKDSRWPKIWGWPLAILYEDQQRFPDVVPGNCLLVFKRFGDDLMGEDRPRNERFLGHVLPVKLIHLENLVAVLTPSPVPQEY